jgi:hypothetical protein
MQCATHPNVETELGCSRCGKAICSRCLVHTPVGARCRECANIRRIPTYNLGSETFVRGAGTAVAVGAATGGVWYFFNGLTFALGIFLTILLGLGIGYVIGEAVQVAANRRAGPPLQVIAVAGVVIAYLVRTSLLVIVDGWTFADLRAIDVFALLAVAAAGWVAAQRNA